MPSPSFSKRGGGVSLARAQKLGIRASRVSSWSRSNSFNFLVLASVTLIIIIIAQSFLSFSTILSQIDFHRMPLSYDSLSPRTANGTKPSQDICSSRQQHKWRDDLNRYFSEAADGIPPFVVVLTVNTGFWDFFVNWLKHFYGRAMSDQPLLIIIAEDSAIYEKLQALPRSKTKTRVVLPGYDFANDSASEKAEDYDSESYKSLVSSRATHLLNLMCILEGGGSNEVANETVANGGTKTKKEEMIIVYSDVDTVWLKDPFPYIQMELFGSNNDGNQTQQQPKYDILAAVDDHDYHNFTTYYCTGYLVIAQTPASIGFLSRWENELQSNPQLNQPIFNSLLRSTEIPEIRHGGLEEMKFPPGRLYFDEWLKEGMESERQNKMETMVVHNNYIIGHDAKKERFQDQGLWMNE